MWTDAEDSLKIRWHIYGLRWESLRGAAGVAYKKFSLPSDSYVFAGGFFCFYDKHISGKAYRKAGISRISRDYNCLYRGGFTVGAVGDKEHTGLFLWDYGPVEYATVFYVSVLYCYK